MENGQQYTMNPPVQVQQHPQYFVMPAQQQQQVFHNHNQCGILHFHPGQSNFVIVPRVSPHPFGMVPPFLTGSVQSFVQGPQVFPAQVMVPQGHQHGYQTQFIPHPHQHTPRQFLPQQLQPHVLQRQFLPHPGQFPASTSITSPRFANSSASQSEVRRISNLPEASVISSSSVVSAEAAAQAMSSSKKVKAFTPIEQLRSQILNSTAQDKPQIRTSPADTDEDTEVVTILAPKSIHSDSEFVIPEIVHDPEAFEDLLNELFPVDDVMILNPESIKLVELLVYKSKGFPIPKCTTLEIHPETPVVEFIKHMTQLIKIIGSQVKFCVVHLWKLFNIPSFNRLFDDKLPNLEELVICGLGSGIGELRLPPNSFMSTIKLPSTGVNTEFGTFELPHLFSCLPQVDNISFKFEKRSSTYPCPTLLNGLHLTEFHARSALFSAAVGKHLMYLPCLLEAIHLDGIITVEFLHFLWNHKSTLRSLYVSDVKNVSIDYLNNFKELEEVMYGDRMCILMEKNGSENSEDTYSFYKEPVTYVGIDLNQDSKDDILSLLAVSEEVVDEDDFERADNPNLYLAQITFARFSNLTGLMVTIHCTDIFKEIWIHLSTLTELRIDFDAKAESIGVLDPYFIGRDLWYQEVTLGHAKVDAASLEQPLISEYDEDLINMARLKNLEKFELYLRNGETTIGDLTILVCFSKMKKLKHVFAQRTLVSQDQVTFLIGILGPEAYVRLELYPFSYDELPAMSQDD